jgi:hypothetical protein
MTVRAAAIAMPCIDIAGVTVQHLRLVRGLCVEGRWRTASRGRRCSGCAFRRAAHAWVNGVVVTGVDCEGSLVGGGSAAERRVLFGPADWLPLLAAGRRGWVPLRQSRVQGRRHAHAARHEAAVTRHRIGPVAEGVAARTHSGCPGGRPPAALQTEGHANGLWR